VGTVTEAAAALPANAEVLLTTGHSGLETFLERDDCHFLVRTIEAPTKPLPLHAKLLQSRPPYSLGHELALMRAGVITHLVTQNSFVGKTAAKLAASQQFGVKTIMVARPSYGPALEVVSIDAAITELQLDGLPKVFGSKAAAHSSMAQVLLADLLLASTICP